MLNSGLNECMKIDEIRGKLCTYRDVAWLAGHLQTRLREKGLSLLAHCVDQSHLRRYLLTVWLKFDEFEPRRLG